MIKTVRAKPSAEGPNPVGSRPRHQVLQGNHLPQPCRIILAARSPHRACLKTRKAPEVSLQGAVGLNLPSSPRPLIVVAKCWSTGQFRRVSPAVSLLSKHLGHISPEPGPAAAAGRRDALGRVRHSLARVDLSRLAKRPRIGLALIRRARPRPSGGEEDGISAACTEVMCGDHLPPCCVVP